MNYLCQTYSCLRNLKTKADTEINEQIETDNYKNPTEANVVEEQGQDVKYFFAYPLGVRQENLLFCLGNTHDTGITFNL